MAGSTTVTQHFAGNGPTVKSSYDGVLKEARKLGQVLKEPKKTSIHQATAPPLHGSSRGRQKHYLWHEFGDVHLIMP